MQEEFWKYYEQLIQFQEKDAKANGKGNIVIHDYDGFSLNDFGSVDGNLILSL